MAPWTSAAVTAALDGRSHRVVRSVPQRRPVVNAGPHLSSAALRVFTTAAVVWVLGVPPASSTPRVVTVRASAAQRAVVDEVVAAFDREGLALPRATVVTFQAPTAACDGGLGLHDVAGGRDRIEVCLPPDVGPVQVGHVVAHEFAHAHLDRWADRDTRIRFLRSRGLTAWDDRTQPWSRRGAEEAAEIVAWGVVRSPLLLLELPDKSCEALAAGYRLLAGHRPPHPRRCPQF